MRAEEHYVDEITRPDRATRGVAWQDDDLPAPQDRDRENPLDADRSVAAERQERILDQVLEELRAIESAAGLLTDRGAAVSRRVGLDLIRAEARRAAWLTRADALVGKRRPAAARPQPIGTLLTQVRESLLAECRLAGVTLQMQASDPQATVTVDDDLLMTGMVGAILATLGLVSADEAAVIRVTAVALGGDLRTVEVRQESSPVPGELVRRFFDAAYTDRPGGWLAALGADAARAAAREHGGDAIVVTKDRRGSTIRLTLSQLT
jgi:C4-dicarboxylate-specific signal transduction histidine kinase